MKRGRSSSASLKEKEVSSDSSSSEEEVAVKKKKSPATKKKAKTAASPAKKKAKTSGSDTEGKKKPKTKKETASPAKKKTTAKKKATPTKRKTKKQKEAEAAAAAAGPVEEWKELPWTYTSFLPTSRLQAHCQAVDKKKEGYVSLQQFKRILSAILPMAEFSGKKELDRITAAAESLVRKGFVPYTLFKASASTSSTAPVLMADDPVEIFKRGLKTNPKSITPEQMDAIKEDERQLAKLKQQHLLHSLAKKEKHSEFSVAAATILLAMGVEVDDRLTNGATPFIMACKQRNLQAARFLLENGADVNAADLEKMTGLYWPCVHGDLELVKLLLEHRGAKSDGSAADAADQQPIVDVNTTTEVRGLAPYKSGGLSPLMVAIQACSHLSVQQVQIMKKDYAKKQENQMESEDEQAADNFEYLVTDRETIVSLLLPHVRDINQTTPGGESAMTMAVAKANPYVIQRILQTFAGTIKLDGVSDSKQTLLHTAVGLNVFAYEVTKLLANAKGTKVNAFDGGGKTPLFRACESNNTDAALALLQAGANPSLGNGKQLPLHLAAQYHNAYVAHHLLEAGADVNATDEDGRNVLHLIFEGQLSRMRHTSEHSEDAVPVHLRSSLKNCLRLFGARGANVEQRDVIGNLPLAYALVFNHFSLVPAVLDMSTPKNLDLLAPVCYTHVMPVKPECQESDYDESLHANEERREPAEGMSAEDKAKLGQVTRWLAAMREYRRRERSLSSFRQYAGESALHFFVKQGKLELVREVIGRLGDPREINTPTSISGDTALLLACRRQDTRMMELLLKNGADVNIANAQNQSPLHAVLQSSHGDPIASVSLLCDVEGVLIDNPDASGWTPLALAAQQGAVMSSLCLLNHGANIDAADKLGNTPLVQALVASHVTYGALLMQKGASLNTKVTTAITQHKWIPSKRMMQAIQKHESSTLFDFAALRNYEGLCFLMLDIGMEGSQLFAAFQHLLHTGKYTLAQVLIKKYSASEERRTELRNLDVNALVGVISGLRVSNNDERYREWWQELVDRLLELRPADAAAGALVPDPSSNAKLPTLLAAEANHPQVLRYLTQQGLDFTVPGKDGETLLHIAARKNLPQVITAVIGETKAATDAAMEVEAEEDEEAERRKKEAELNGRNRKRLAAIINARNSGQQTALIRATHTHSFASYRNDKLLSALLTIQGIDVNAQDAKGNTALFYAVKTSADTCVGVLLAHGASPNIACERGETAVFVAARNNSSVIMEALLAKGADPHSINANGDRLLALCKPLAAAGLYHFVRSAAAAAASPTLVDLFPEFKPREGEAADAVVAQLVGLVELLNEGLQLYSDRQQLLEELRQLVVAHLTSVDAKQSSRIPRNTKQLSFSSLSPEELAALKKKRKNEKEADADDEDEAEAEADNDGVAAKKAKVANGDQVKKEGQAEGEEEEVIEEPDIEIGDDIEQIPFPPPKKWSVKLAQRFVDDEFKRRYRAEATRVYLLWGADGRSGEDDDAEEKSQADNDDDENVGYLYDAKLNLCDISYGTYGHNKYYIIQAFGNRARPDLFYLWTRWARVGSYGFESQFQTYATKEEAIKAFEQKFRDKTKNNWRERADFQQAHDRYFYIPATHEIEDDNAPKAGVDDGDGDDASEKVDPACNLPGSVQSLLHLISNRKEFMHTYAAYGLRTAGLGSLTSGQIRNGFKLLKIISGIITFIDKKNSKGQPVPPRFRTALVELSNKYYSIIPYNFGRQLPDVISQTSQVSEQMRILESLADIDMGVQILAEAEQGLAGEGHVLEKLYAALHTQLTPVDKSSDEWLVVNEFMGKSGLSVLDAFAVEREGEAMRFRPFSHLPNRTLLAHGTRLANTMGILRQGLRIAPPEAPHSGYMFGKGIYFADVAEKSVGYCGLGTGEVGVFLLCEVALGNQYPCYGATYIEVLPRGKHSTLGCGRQVPSPSASIYTDEGVKIPLGRKDAGQKEGAVKRRLTYNEHIVYNEGQVRIRYILKVRRG